MSETKVVQHGEKSLYFEENTGQITIHSSNGEVRIINPQLSGDLELLRKEFGDQFSEVLKLLKNLESARKIPHALTPPPFLPEIFLGRKDDLQRIHDRLFAPGSNLLLLVNGEGGVGKTSIASKYFHNYQHEYEHVAWVLSEKSISAALLLLALPLGLRFDEQMGTDERLENLLQAMANLKKPCLLVLDNANELDDLEAHYQRLRRCSNFHLLLTTRITDFEQAETCRIEGLPKDEALALFERHYHPLPPEEQTLFEQIREAVGANTLVLELLAKNLAGQNRLRQRYTLADLLKDLQGHGLLQLAQSQEVRTDYQSKAGQMRREKPGDIIAAMYDLSELPPEETALLSVFAVLPAESIPFAALETLLPGLPGLDGNLLALAQKGWIEYNQTASTFKCSPVVQEVTKIKNQDLPENCRPLVKALIKELSTEVLHVDNYKHSTFFTRYAEAIVSSLNKVDDDLGTLCQNIGNFHIATGDLGKAMQAYQTMADIQLALFSEEPDNASFKNGLAISYEKLGETHTALGNLDKALTFFEKDIELSKELYAAYPQNVSFKNGLAISYSKLGSTHTALGNLDKALTFFEERSRLGEELYAAYPQNVSFKNGLAVSYSQLGRFYRDKKGDKSKAKPHFQQCFTLWKELSETYPSYVEFQKNFNWAKKALDSL